MSWFRIWFDELYPVVYSSRNREQADAEVRFIATQLPGISKLSCLDLGCGDGRHLLGLGRLANRVVGVDLSAALLEIARTSISNANNVSIIRADFRALPFPSGSFHLLTSLFTGFGYLDSDDEHLHLLREWCRVLVPNGSFVLDFLDREFVLSNIVPLSEREESYTDGESYPSILKITEHRRLSTDRFRIEKDVDVLFVSSGEKRSYHESVRAYSADEVFKLLDASGFIVKSSFADYTGTPYRPGLGRLIIVASKR